MTALRLFKDMLSDGGVLPSDEPEIADVIIDGWGKHFFERNGRMLVERAQQQKDFKWLALVLEGEWNILEAWRSRGGGWASTVKAEGWRGFETHSAQAHKALEQAWQLHPERPFAPARMVYVVMGESDAEAMRLWFDRALAAQIDNPAAWHNMRWGLRPRWHGSLEAMLALGITAVQTHRFDTDVPRKFFDVVTDLEQEMQLPSGEHIYGREDIWPHLKEMYEGYIEAPSESANQDGWRSTYAAVSYLAGHLEVSREQLEKLNWKPKTWNLTGWGKDLSLLPLEVAARTGSSSNEVARAEKAYVHGEVAQPVKVYQDLQTSANADERTQAFCRSRLASLKRELQLAEGDWIDLIPHSKDDADWVIWESQKLRWLEDGAVEVKVEGTGHGFHSRTHVGPNLEVQGEVQFVSSPDKKFEAGVLMGFPDTPNSDWYSFRLIRMGDEGSFASFSCHWGTPNVLEKVSLKDGWNQFRFRCENGKADAWVNEAQIMRQASPSKTTRLPQNSLLGLGGFNDGKERVVRYRNMKVRRVGSGQQEQQE